jgi:hypothetical protein
MLALDPNADDLPKRSELPDIPGAPPGAAWFWGQDDNVGDRSVKITMEDGY